MTMQGSASDKENLEISKDFREMLKVNVSDEKKTAKQEEGGNEEEFSFACSNPDDIFQNEKFRTIFPLFDQSLLYCDGDGDTDGNFKNDSQSSPRPPLRKLVMEGRPDFEITDMTAEEEAAGPFGEWSSGNTTVQEVSSEPCKKRNSTGFSKLWRFRGLALGSNSDGKDAFIFLNNNNNKCESKKPEKYSACKKRNSTGFSKLWRFRGLVLGSNSDGQDAFIFLNNNNNNNTCESEKPEKYSEKPEKPLTSGKTTTTNHKTSKGSEKVGNLLKVTGDNKKVKAETVSSMYEKHYLKNRVMREGDKRSSYSPYRQDLVSFFADVNGLSRSVHPF